MKEKLDYNTLNGKVVILTTLKKNSKYTGTLVIKKSDKERVLLKNIIVLNKDGSFKAVSGSYKEDRFFNRNNIREILVYKPF